MFFRFSKVERAKIELMTIMKCADEISEKIILTIGYASLSINNMISILEKIDNNESVHTLISTLKDINEDIKDVLDGIRGDFVSYASNTGYYKILEFLSIAFDKSESFLLEHQYVILKDHMKAIWDAILELNSYYSEISEMGTIAFEWKSNCEHIWHKSQLGMRP